MRRVLINWSGKAAFGLLIFVVLLDAIVGRPAKRLHDFDQQFYLTIAYDLNRHGVFSNSIFDGVDSTIAVPPPGMFFGPVYPLLILGVMKLDPRFGQAATCSVEADHKRRPSGDCEIYARPIHIMHALLLTIGVLAAALAGEIIFARVSVFFLAGAIAAAGIAAEAELLSYVMTESATLSLYSMLGLPLVLAWKTARNRYFVAAGLLLGVLCLTRTAYVVLAPAITVLTALNARRLGAVSYQPVAANVLALLLPFLLIMGAWATRNAISVGKFGLTEEYGSVSLVERFAYNDMTAREFALAGPYCVPVVGPYAVDRLFGDDAMARFGWWQPGGFFDAGRSRRNALVATYGRLDPIIKRLVGNEMQQNWWRYLMTMLPLAWCGMWIAGSWSTVCLPMFAAACVQAIRRPVPLFLLYSAPPLVMVGVHAAFANHYSRYNLGLIGPISAGSAWIMMMVARATLLRLRAAQQA
jgi:hypothetical protein